MKISTKGRYGARAMVELALQYDKRRLSAGEIAAKQGISVKYLESILAVLKTARLITSEKGKNGGYSLIRAPEEISLYAVVCPLEDSLCIVHCTGDDVGCDRLESCVTREVWLELKNAIDRILKNTTLKDLVDRQQAREALLAQETEPAGAIPE